MVISSQAKRKLKGIVPVLLTPMNIDSSPDLDGMQHLVDMLVNAGVGGLWALGSASEDINLSFSEKVITAKAIASANSKRVPVIMGTGLTAINDILSYIDKISDLAIDGVHILPYDTKMGESRMIHFFTHIAERSPFPLWLYHNPKRGRAITDVVIAELKEHPNISGIKVGGYNLTELTSAIMHRTDNFDVIGAGSGQLYTMLSLGAEAHTTSEASAIPEPFIEIYNLFKNGELSKAKEKQTGIIRLSREFPRTDNGEYAAEEKYILSLRDVCEEWVNPLYRTLANDEKNTLHRVLEKYGFAWI